MSTLKTQSNGSHSLVRCSHKRYIIMGTWPPPSYSNPPKNSFFLLSNTGAAVQYITSKRLNRTMASLVMSFAPATTRVFAATAAKGAGGGAKEEKGFLDWILGGMQKEDQLLETDPILKKVEEKNGGTTSGRSKNTVAVPQKKKGGGFGGLFAKN